MPVLPIITGEDAPILKQKTKKVKSVNKDIERLIDDMLLTVKDANGAGIAAPQVDRTERVCIARIGEDFVPLINPEITWMSEETDSMEEGCLSLPKMWLDIVRSKEIVVKYETPKGKERELKLTDFDARVVQHEVDHLDGILITDREKQ